MSYNEISSMMANAFQKQGFELDDVSEAWLPAELFAEFKRETQAMGFSLSWWGIPVKSQNNIGSITFVKTV